MRYIDFGSERERVKNLQELLRSLSILEGKKEYGVAADGSFDESTRRAVEIFQAEHGLAVTGIPDNETWDILKSEAEEAQRTRGNHRSIDPFGGHFRDIPQGETSELVLIVQIMLREIAEYHTFDVYVPLSGTLDTPTSEAIAEFQSVSELAVTGEIDLVTWNRMALEYGGIESQ